MLLEKWTVAQVIAIESDVVAKASLQQAEPKGVALLPQQPNLMVPMAK